MLDQEALDSAAAVTPSDTADLPGVARAIYIGGAGNVKVTMRNNSVVTLNGVLAGTIYRIMVKRVWSAGTTATNIIALF